MATFGYETYDSYPVYDPYEEERQREEERRRLEAETPTKQTVTINPDGTKDVTISGSATNLAQMSQQSRARAMPIPTAPVAPDTYQRMLQIESGNRDYTASGAPVTSPAGAMFASQVMPATAARPGYGIQPAQAQTPEEYNRVGREYFDAMKKKYGGNDELAAAAYHSGPGNVDRALQQSQQTGQDWRTYLGPQGQAYVAAAVPGRVAAPAPVAPEAPAPAAAAPAAAPAAPAYNMGEFAGVDQAVAQQAAQPQPTYTTAQTEAALAQQGKERYVNEFIAAQNSPKDMVAFINNPEAPEELRNQMEKSYYDALKTKYRLNETSDRFRNAVQSGDTKQVAKMMNAPGEEGSIVKAFLFSLIGFQSGAQAEVAKMNLPGKWQAVANEDGERGMVQFSTSGAPLRGLKADGTPMDQNELVGFASGGLGKWQTSAEFFQDKSGNIYQSQHNDRGQTRVVNVKTGATYKGDESLERLRDVSRLSQMEQQQIYRRENDNAAFARRIAGLDYDAKLKAVADYRKSEINQGRPDLTDAELAGLGVSRPSLNLFTQTGQVAGAPAGPAVPGPTGAVPATTPAPAAEPAGAVPPTPIKRESVEDVQRRQAQEKIERELGQKKGEGVIKVMDEEIRPQAVAGDTVSSVRKQQFEMFKRPGVDANKIFGLATGAGQPAGEQKWTMLRDIFAGAVASNSDGSPMNGQQLSQRLQGLNLTPAEISALAEYNIANQKINSATLKQTAGPGSVSNAEQQINKESNVDPTKIPALGAYNAMAQSQFDGDRARYKADWIAGKDFKTALEMDKAWRKENQRLADMYADIARQRIKYINANGNTTNAVQSGYDLFPVPQYDPQREDWIKTKPLSSYNR